MELENEKQYEYLNDIKDIGMSIVFGECTGRQIYKTFKPYLHYLDDAIKVEYLQTLWKIIANLSSQTPDDILFKMGKFTKKIKYKTKESMYMYAEL